MQYVNCYMDRNPIHTKKKGKIPTDLMDQFPTEPSNPGPYIIDVLIRNQTNNEIELINLLIRHTQIQGEQQITSLQNNQVNRRPVKRLHIGTFVSSFIMYLW